MSEVRNMQRGAATVLAAIGRFSRRLTGNKGLAALIAEIEKQPKISVPDDPKNLSGHRETADMILRALDMIGGPKFRAQVLAAAGLSGGTADWDNSLKATVRAFSRAQTALVTVKPLDRKKILGFVSIRIQLA